MIEALVAWWSDLTSWQGWSDFASWQGWSDFASWQGWSDFASWQGWRWPGWIALGSIGAVGALFFLGYQTWRLRIDSIAEARQRRSDDRRRLEDFQFRHTPLISAVGSPPPAGSSPLLDGRDRVTVLAVINAEGEGVAYNVIANLFGIQDGKRAGSLGKSFVVPQIDPPEQHELTFTYTLADLPHKPPLSEAIPHQVELEVGFFNMFGQRIVFKHSCRVSHDGLEITDWPRFTWPWEFAGGTFVKEHAS